MKLSIKSYTSPALIFLFFVFASIYKTSAQTGDSSLNNSALKLNDSIVTLTPVQLNQIGDVAKTLTGHKDYFITFPAEFKKSSIKHIKIDKEEKEFALPTGNSRVVLIQLPDYSKPYNLKVRSVPHGFSTKVKLFSPRAVFFDSGFNYKQEISDTSFSLLNEKWLLPLRLETDILIDEKLRDYRYLFIYTLNKSEKLGNYINYGGGLVGLLINHPIITTPTGKLEIQVKFIK